jgi:hypothetical protein
MALARVACQATKRASAAKHSRGMHAHACAGQARTARSIDAAGGAEWERIRKAHTTTTPPRTALEMMARARARASGRRLRSRRVRAPADQVLLPGLPLCPCSELAQ